MNYIMRYIIHYIIHYNLHYIIPKNINSAIFKKINNFFLEKITLFCWFRKLYFAENGKFRDFSRFFVIPHIVRQNHILDKLNNEYIDEHVL